MRPDALGHALGGVPIEVASRELGGLCFSEELGEPPNRGFAGADGPGPAVKARAPEVLLEDLGDFHAVNRRRGRLAVVTVL